MGTVSENANDRELTDSELNEITGGDHSALAQSLSIGLATTVGAGAGMEGGAVGSGAPIVTGAAAGVSGGTRGPKPA